MKENAASVLGNIFNFVTFIYCRHTYTMVELWRAEDEFQEFVF